MFGGHLVPGVPLRTSDIEAMEWSVKATQMMTRASAAARPVPAALANVTTAVQRAAVVTQDPTDPIEDG